jgi:hypothetical protein
MFLGVFHRLRRGLGLWELSVESYLRRVDLSNSGYSALFGTLPGRVLGFFIWMMSFLLVADLGSRD